ncbi:efflux RND transporter periplasmic adaptor subunit [Tundrisphaera sp. TA3]|uniref:efflux RND transporter periplasmic adaptor subunit n=1 Tax=Tundrisphaera sp. TA3 TaxID=3435775 RepID=UPI003EBEE699
MDEPGTASAAQVPQTPDAPRPRSGGHGLGWLAALVVLAAGAGGAYLFYGRGPAKASAGPEKPRAGIAVVVARPRPGGIERTTTQAGSVHPFEHAALFAKVSGYLKDQNVDIGSRVKRGDLLAVIDDPEVDQAVAQNAASLEQAKARVGVAESKIRSTTADKDAADAMVKESEVDVASKAANQELQSKQLDRIRGLVERNAVEARLLDEQQDRFDVATSDLGAARAAVLTAKAQALARQALIDSARADLAEAKANVGVAEANLARAKVMQDYTRITSPYDGVITLRSFHRGDFVRSASEGGTVPVLAVAVTDKMRVVMPVPDVDVPYTNPGDPATLRIVALPGSTFHGVVSRIAESEDPQSRNMRTEIDLPNPDGLLREGMYGRITLLLQKAAPGSVTIPSSGLVGQAGTGEGSVYVVRDGKARQVGVKVGSDNGIDAEILEGLSTGDSVIVRYNGSIADGTPVAPEPG